MRAIPIPLGKGFDASTYVTPDQAARLVKPQPDDGEPYRFAVRYLRRDQYVYERPDTSWPVSLSKQELGELLSAGLAVGLVQFGRFHGRRYLSAARGASHGFNAVWNASRLGVPEGVTLYTDAEWTDSPPDSLVLDYLRAWGQAVAEAGYRPGCYIAYDGLTRQQWYGLPYYRTYWASAMHAALLTPPLPRGYSLYQHTQRTDCGVVLDPCYSVADLRGDRPWVVAP